MSPLLYRMYIIIIIQQYNYNYYDMCTYRAVFLLQVCTFQLKYSLRWTKTRLCSVWSTQNLTTRPLKHRAGKLTYRFLQHWDIKWGCCWLIYLTSSLFTPQKWKCSINISINSDNKLKYGISYWPLTMMTEWWWKYLLWIELNRIVIFLNDVC